MEQKKEFSSSLFIFRRDLRIEDNTALDQAINQSKKITPIFIFDPRQMTQQKNKFFSQHAFTAMLESLTDLEKQLIEAKSKLIYSYGIAEEVVKEILKTENFDALFFNADYTPFSKERDKNIEKLCKEANVSCIIKDDALLIGSPKNIQNKQGKPYKIFSAFFKTAQQNNSPKKPTPRPKKLPPSQAIPKSIAITASTEKKIFKHTAKNSPLPGGSNNAETLLQLIKNQKQYEETRNIPSKKTTELSLHNKFGTISIRKFWHTVEKKLGPNHELIRQLYWRDFFTYTAYHYPNLLTKSLRPKNEPTAWNKSSTQFTDWCNGKTGIPFIDAGMRQLNKTGYMHNRVRMLAASYLVKNLKINWRKGAQYFAQNLVDYDPSVNAGNWQWVSSTGYDAQPPFRTFNPWTQQKKFDPDCTYIKQWIPELAPYTAQQIHKHQKKPIATYIKPPQKQK